MTSDVTQQQPKTAHPVQPTSLPTRSSHYFPEIDGIRAIAVLVVLFCHAKLLGLTGGFIGVDIFFVISGYVVTLAITRQQAAGQFSLSDFYARRLRRLLPALYTVAFATLVFCLLFNFPETNFKLIKNLGFLILFASNIFLSRQSGYFDLESAKQPLLHTWSLSVEEQFYLLLPLTLVFLRRFQPRTRAIALGAALVLALVFSIPHTARVGAAGYYFLPARLFEFLFGVVLALGIGRLAFLRGYLADLLVVLGLAGVVACSLKYGPQTVMPGVNAVWPCLAAVLLIAGGRYAGMLRPVLSNPPLRYLGRISYPLYLWHWPLIFAFNKFGLRETGWMCMALGLSLVLAALTHHWIEKPWRARWQPPGRTWLILWVLPVLFVLGLYVLAKQTEHFSTLYPQKYRDDYLNAGQAVFDHPRADHCFGQVPVSPADKCTLGMPDAPIKAVLWGDSHAYHQIGLMDGIGKARGIAVHDMTMKMCAPVANSPGRAGLPFLQGHAEECRAHNIEVMKHLLAHPEIKLVFMGVVWGIYGGSPTEPGTHGYLEGQFEAELSSTIAQLNAAGKRVILLDDVPFVPEGLENCASDRLYLPVQGPSDCGYSREIADQAYQGTAQAIARIVQAHPTTAVINTYDVFCDETRCYSEMDGVPLYMHDDRGHLSAGGTRIFYQLYMRKHPQQLDRIFGGSEK